MENEKSVVTLDDVASNVVVYDEEYFKRVQDMQKKLADSAKTRRRRHTPKSDRKTREGGDGKSYTYAARPAYQIWLDDTFPGWSVSDEKYWADMGTMADDSGKVQTLPILFSCSLKLHVIDTGIKRVLPGVGSAPVHAKEMKRGTTHLFKEKYRIAQTEAIKTACSWFGAFFDLRDDEEARERANMPPTPEQTERFNLLLLRTPVTARTKTNELWSQQNAHSADTFLNGMELKVVEYEKQLKSMETQNG
jgi:hypothetical protein